MTEQPVIHAVYVLSRGGMKRLVETATVCGAEGLEARDADEHITCYECRRIALEQGVDLS